MMQSYEAEVREDGQVRLREPLALRGRYRAVLTVLEPLEAERTDARIVGEPQDWRRFVGTMRRASLFKDDPMVIQKALRDEWD